MATKTESIMSLLTQIRNDQQLVLPDLQRDFVWSRDQIRLLMDSIMRGYPFGSLLFWQTRFLAVPYRDFVIDFLPGMVFVPKQKPAGTPLRMVLDGQQRLQSLYIAIYGTHDKRRLYFNIASGPGAGDAEGGDSQDELTTSVPFRVLARARLEPAQTAGPRRGTRELARPLRGPEHREGARGGRPDAAMSPPVPGGTSGSSARSSTRAIWSLWRPSTRTPPTSPRHAPSTKFWTSSCG